MDRHDADLVGLARDDQRAEAVELPELMLPLLQALGIFQREDAVFGDDVEQGDIDGVDALAEDAPLAAFLPFVGEELAGVLEVVALDDFAQGLRRFEVFAAAGEDIADLALLDRDQGELVNGILPAPEAEVNSAAEDVGLIAGLAVQGDDRAFGERPAAGPEFLHDADAVVRDIARREPGGDEQYRQDHNQVNQERNQHGKHGLVSKRGFTVVYLQGEQLQDSPSFWHLWLVIVLIIQVFVDLVGLFHLLHGFLSQRIVMRSNRSHQVLESLLLQVQILFDFALPGRFDILLHGVGCVGGQSARERPPPLPIDRRTVIGKSRAESVLPQVVVGPEDLTLALGNWSTMAMKSRGGGGRNRAPSRIAPEPATARMPIRSHTHPIARAIRSGRPAVRQWPRRRGPRCRSPAPRVRRTR